MRHGEGVWRDGPEIPFRSPGEQAAGVAALSFNCVPKFVDVRYDTYLMDPAQVEKAVTRHTKALIVTNL